MNKPQDTEIFPPDYMRKDKRNDLWLTVEPNGMQNHWLDEASACTWQRAMRRKRGLNPMTGEKR